MLTESNGLFRADFSKIFKATKFKVNSDMSDSSNFDDYPNIVDDLRKIINAYELGKTISFSNVPIPERTESYNDGSQLNWFTLKGNIVPTITEITETETPYTHKLKLVFSISDAVAYVSNIYHIIYTYKITVDITNDVIHFNSLCAVSKIK